MALLSIDFGNLSQLFIFGLATSFGTVLATRIATKLLDFIEVKTKLALVQLGLLSEKERQKETKVTESS